MFLEPGEGVCESETYKDIVRRGKKPDFVTDSIPDGFIAPPEDNFFSVETPAGNADIFYLSNRSDFVRTIQIIAHRCKNDEIPSTMNATTLFGVINWRKIENSAEDFETFTSKKENYTDSIIIIGKGGYSGLDYEAVKNILTENAEKNAAEKNDLTLNGENFWLEKSFLIRLYHECCHFVCRKLFPEKIDALFDEIMADCIGLIAAFGKYSEALARKFLGIDENGNYIFGRLENYFPDFKDNKEKLDELGKTAVNHIKFLKEESEKWDFFTESLDSAPSSENNSPEKASSVEDATPTENYLSTQNVVSLPDSSPINKKKIFIFLTKIMKPVL